MSARQRPTPEFLRQCLREENGRLFWKYRPVEHFKDQRVWKIWNTKYAGKEAGSREVKKSGDRWAVRINNRSLFYRYQLIWVIVKGEWADEIDHKNLDPLDDRIDNLRLCTHIQNMANTKAKSTNKSGYKGVFWHGQQNKWRANIKIQGKAIFLGCFDDPAKAHMAYVKAAKEHFGEFAFQG